MRILKQRQLVEDKVNVNELTPVIKRVSDWTDKSKTKLLATYERYLKWRRS